MPSPELDPTLEALVEERVRERIRQYEERDRLHAVGYAATLAMAESETVSEAIGRFMRETTLALGWRCAAYWHLEGEELVCQEFWASSDVSVEAFEAVSRSTKFGRGIGLPGRVWESGESTWVADVLPDANFPRAKYALACSLHGAFCFAVKVGKEIEGVFEFFNDRIEEPDAALLQTTTSIGRQFGQFIKRKRAEETIQASEERLHRIVAERVKGDEDGVRSRAQKAEAVCEASERAAELARQLVRALAGEPDER